MVWFTIYGNYHFLKFVYTVRNICVLASNEICVCSLYLPAVGAADWIGLAISGAQRTLCRRLARVGSRVVSEVFVSETLGPMRNNLYCRSCLVQVWKLLAFEVEVWAL